MKPDCMTDEAYHAYIKDMTPKQIERNLCWDCTPDYALAMSAKGKCAMYSRSGDRHRVGFNDFIKKISEG